MTDLTPTLTELLHTNKTHPKQQKQLSPSTPDEFLKEAYRINSHITSLLSYLHKIRPSYLSTAQHKHHHHHSTPSSKPNTHTNTRRRSQKDSQNHQTDHADDDDPLSPSDLDTITSSTSHLLSTLSTSITNLSAAESLRQETLSTLLDKKYSRRSARGKASGLLFRWAAGGRVPGEGEGDGDEGSKSAEQIADEEKARTLKTVREGILWFLRRRLEVTVAVQRDMVERRIERARERERSVLYMVQERPSTLSPMPTFTTPTTPTAVEVRSSLSSGLGQSISSGIGAGAETTGKRAPTLDESEVAAIEAELSPEQLQLFAEENDSMVRYYEDTLSKVQNAEKSLLEISSLQQTLVSHLATQEEYIGQLVMDAENTETNIGRGNKELRRATERRTAAQAVFWGTVGLCTWLVVWDLIF